MSNRTRFYCILSILLSLCVVTALWRYVGKEYKGLFIIAMIVAIRLNIFFFYTEEGIII
jgi:hypothetical protein